MRGADSRAALTEEVARFQDEVRQLAFAAIREILEQELERRLARLASAQPARPGRGATGGRGPRARQLPARARQQPAATRPREQPPAATVQEPATDGAGEQTAADKPPQQLPPPSGKGKRMQWTRESIISELASWMASGTSIDAAFVTRHGPPGLVAATRRIFGRFDAALNLAGLHLSKLYPDGPPER